jgi:uncharacterized protein
MTPQERQLIDDLFDRLAKVESAPRDAEAMSAIMQGLRNAPNAIYPLVQTVLLQDEALKRANHRIEELEAASAPEQTQSGGFLDSMRESIFGQGHGSVPNVRPPEMSNRPVWNSGQVLQQGQSSGQFNQTPHGEPYNQPYNQPYAGPQAPMGGGGGSFLGTAAAAAAGTIGGSLLLNSIRGMMGGHQAFGGTPTVVDETIINQAPGDQSRGDLARDAGLNDIGSSAGRDDNSRAGLFDSASNDDDHDDMDLDSDDFGNDNDSDYA